MCSLFQVYEREQEPLYATQSTSFDMTNDFKFLTPEKVRNRIRNIKYEGDPDLHPIRSNENVFLVRTLYQLSQKINEIVSTLSRTSRGALHYLRTPCNLQKMALRTEIVGTSSVFQNHDCQI